MVEKIKCNTFCKLFNDISCLLRCFTINENFIIVEIAAIFLLFAGLDTKRDLTMIARY